MCLDLLTFLDYSWGGGNFIFTMFYVSVAFSIPVFTMCMGHFWYASCREWSLLMVLTDALESQMVGQNISYLGGPFQLMLSLIMCLMWVNVCSLLPFAYPVVTHVAITGGLSFPFWFSTLLCCFNMNWRSFFAKFVLFDSWLVSCFFQGLEVITMMIRGFTLCFRMSINVMVSLVFAKLFFSQSLGIFWFSGWSTFSTSVMLFALGTGYYVAEWFVAFIQCWLFVILLVSYVNDAVLSMKGGLDVTASKDSVL